MAKTDTKAVHRTEPTRLPNPYDPGKAHDGEPAPSVATVIKLWSGGERARAAKLADTLKLPAGDIDKVRAACPGWDELANQE